MVVTCPVHVYAWNLLQCRYYTLTSIFSYVAATTVVVKAFSYIFPDRIPSHLFTFWTNYAYLKHNNFDVSSHGIGMEAIKGELFSSIKTKQTE